MHINHCNRNKLPTCRQTFWGWGRSRFGRGGRYRVGDGFAGGGWIRRSLASVEEFAGVEEDVCEVGEGGVLGGELLVLGAGLVLKVEGFG